MRDECQHYNPKSPYILLTKRSGRMRRFMSDQHYLLAYMRRWLGGKVQHTGIADFPLSNIHIGVSAEDQQHFDERIDDLRATPAAVRWLSLEPLLGPIDLTGRLDGIHWVVVGGESGPGARECNVDWVRSIKQQCHAVGIPCFIKQLGARPFSFRDRITFRGNEAEMPQGFNRYLNDPKGGDPAEWPIDLRVQEYPEEVSNG